MNLRDELHRVIDDVLGRHDDVPPGVADELHEGVNEAHDQFEQEAAEQAAANAAATDVGTTAPEPAKVSDVPPSPTEQPSPPAEHQAEGPNP